MSRPSSVVVDDVDSLGTLKLDNRLTEITHIPALSC
jgi:hypothetical protein